MGANSVIVAEGPGHERDTEAVLADTGFAEPLKRLGIRFVDLNREELAKTPLRAGYTGLSVIFGCRGQFKELISSCRCPKSRRTTGLVSRSV